MGETYWGVRRLFSTLAHGWPGVGLLFAAGYCGHYISGSQHSCVGDPATFGTGFFQLFITTAGLLLIIGLWTPVVATVMMLLESVANRFTTEKCCKRHSAMDLALAIALLGPGAWSVDARIFGWKRVEIDTQKNKR